MILEFRKPKWYLSPDDCPAKYLLLYKNSIVREVFIQDKYYGRRFASNGNA